MIIYCYDQSLSLDFLRTYKILLKFFHGRSPGCRFRLSLMPIECKYHIYQADHTQIVRETILYDTHF